MSDGVCVAGGSSSALLESCCYENYSIAENASESAVTFARCSPLEPTRVCGISLSLDWTSQNSGLCAKKRRGHFSQVRCDGRAQARHHVRQRSAERRRASCAGAFELLHRSASDGSEIRRPAA